MLVIEFNDKLKEVLIDKEYAERVFIVRSIERTDTATLFLVWDGNQFKWLNANEVKPSKKQAS